MRRPGSAAAVAAALACVLLAGCADGSGPTAGPSRSTGPSASPSGSATADPTPSVTRPTATHPAVSLRWAQREWTGALRALVREQSAQFSWGAWVSGDDDAVLTESGVFGVDPLRTSYERVISNPAAQGDDPTEYTVRVRRRGSDAYMQMADWGPWDGCWMRVTADLVSRETGLDLDASPALPISVAVALDSRVTAPTVGLAAFGDPYTEYTAEVPAIEAFQFLGVSAAALVGDQDLLARARAPIVVSLLTGRVKGAAARGPDVLDALRRAHVRVDRRLRRYLSGASASVTITDLGKAVAVRLPAARNVLPDGATRNRTCPARTPQS